MFHRFHGSYSILRKMSPLNYEMQFKGDKNHRNCTCWQHEAILRPQCRFGEWTRQGVKATTPTSSDPTSNPNTLPRPVESLHKKISVEQSGVPRRCVVHSVPRKPPRLIRYKDVMPEQNTLSQNERRRSPSTSQRVGLLPTGTVSGCTTEIEQDTKHGSGESKKKAERRKLKRTFV